MTLTLGMCDGGAMLEIDSCNLEAVLELRYGKRLFLCRSLLCRFRSERCLTQSRQLQMICQKAAWVQLWESSKWGGLLLYPFGTAGPLARWPAPASCLLSLCSYRVTTVDHMQCVYASYYFICHN